MGTEARAVCPSLHCQVTVERRPFHQSPTMQLLLPILALAAAATANPVQMNALSYDDVMKVFRHMSSGAHERQQKAADVTKRMHAQMAEGAAAVPDMLADVHEYMSQVMRDGVRNVQAGRQVAMKAEEMLMAIDSHLGSTKDSCPANVYSYPEGMSFPELPQMSDYPQNADSQQAMVPAGHSEAQEAIDGILSVISMMEDKANSEDDSAASMSELQQEVFDQYDNEATVKLADVVRAVTEMGRGLETNRLNDLKERLDRARQQTEQMHQALSHARAIARIASGLKQAVGSTSPQYISRIAARAQNLSKVLSYVQCQA